MEERKILTKAERLFLIADAEMRLYQAKAAEYPHNAITGERVLKMDDRGHRTAKVDMLTVNGRDRFGDHPHWTQASWVLAMENGRF